MGEGTTLKCFVRPLWLGLIIGAGVVGNAGVGGGDLYHVMRGGVLGGRSRKTPGSSFDVGKRFGGNGGLSGGRRALWHALRVAGGGGISFRG